MRYYHCYNRENRKIKGKEKKEKRCEKAFINTIFQFDSPILSRKRPKKSMMNFFTFSRSHFLETFIMYRVTLGHVAPPLASCSKRRLFHTSTTHYRTFKPGFFTSLLSGGHITGQPREILAGYPLKTSHDTTSCQIPPTCTKMLVRDFIDDSLYNPNYGFYSKPSSSRTEFEEMEQEEDHIQYMKRLAKSRGRVHHHNIQHLRYTLTEIFKVKC